MGSRKSGEKSRGAWNRGALSCRVMTARQRDALCSRRSRNSTRGTGRGKKTERRRERDRERNRRKKRKKRKKKQLPSFIFLRTKRKRVPGSSSSTERSQKK